MPAQYDQTNLEDLFHQVFPERVQPQLNRAGVLRVKMDRISKGVQIGEGGEVYARIPLIIGENPGIGARPHMGTLPDEDTGQYSHARVNLKYNYGGGIVPGPALRAKDKAVAFAPQLAIEIEQTTLGLKRDYSRQMWGDGTGILANPADAVAGPTITVDSTAFLFRRRRVDLLESTTGLPPAGVTNATGRQIVSVDPIASTITLDAALAGGTTTADTRIYNAGSRNAELTGLDAAVFDGNPALGNYQNVDATVVEEWRAVVDTSGGAITDQKVQSLVRQVYEKSGLDDAKFLYVTTPVLRDALIAQLQQDRRYTGEEAISPSAGFMGVKFNGGMVAMDRDCQAGRLYALDLRWWRIYELADWDFMDDDGNRLQRDFARRDAYTWTLYNYSEMACMRRNANGRLEGLTP